jgi:MFS family permease
MERAEVRHNFLALGLDYSLFIIGMSFASQATILPAFAVHLGASNFLIGGIPAVLTLGWFLPSLFAAHHTERLARKLPFVLRYTIWERLPMLALAAVAFFLAARAPWLALGVCFALILLMSGTGGTLMPAWMDIVGRTIPTTLRGRFFGSANLVASVGGLLGSVVTAWLLARFSPPQSYGLCFLGGFVFLVVSYVALSTVREPAGPRPANHVSLGSYLRRMPSLLRRDSNLSWFLVARGLGTLGMMANGFYTVYALRTWQAAEWQVGVFTTLFLAGQVIGNLGMGWLADRTGHRLVLVLGVGALAVGNLVALRAISPETLGPVFALAGIHVAAIHVSSRTILLELAADEGERPTYLGLVNTALAPLNFAGPLVAGLIADRLGFSTVFALAAVFGATGVALLLARVREPRWAGQRAT